MYNSYFGFREKPFKLVPDPDYLFLSQGHEIALAHLTYATEQGEGFVVITGEVGTGKTTLCRNFLDSLDGKTSSAYIFNPRLESAQLLASICSEFGIDTGQTSIKALLDRLNQFLIEQHAAGNKAVVLIDEAQGLSVENLELVRMLSNLETTRSKLIQIILVGQPELGETLDSYELRQLAQRISLNYHLSPLSARETEAYIQHRLRIATQRQTVLFTPNACRSAYHYSGGIPRLINIVCDRSLLLAYTHNRNTVTRKTMQAAIRELRARGRTRDAQRHWRYLIGGAALLCVAAVTTAAYIWYERQAPSSAAQPDASRLQIVAKVPAQPAEPVGAETPAATKNTGALPVAPRRGDKTTAADASATPPVVTGAGASGQKDTIATETPLSKPPSAGGPDALRSREPVRESAPTPNSPREPETPFERGIQPPAEVDKASLAALIDGLGASVSRKAAMHDLLLLWGQTRPNLDLLPAQLDDPAFIDLAARQYGLRAHPARWNWHLIETLDLPVIVAVKGRQSSGGAYLALIGRQGLKLHLSAGELSHPIQADRSAVQPHLAGQMYVLWKNAIGFDMIIGPGASEKAVRSVQSLLHRGGYDNLPMSGTFDTATRDAVRAFQQAYGLEADGLVGPLTKIMLLRIAGSDPMPRLSRGKRGDS